MDPWQSALKRAAMRPRAPSVAVRLPVSPERPGRLDVARAVERGAELEALLADCPPELREAWDERAAVMEFDGGLTRREADLLAAACVFGSAVAWVDTAREVFDGVTLASVTWRTSNGEADERDEAGRVQNGEGGGP